jgi:prephenate dehydratase
MIGYLGPVGTFTQAALLDFMKAYPEKDAQTKYYFRLSSH